MKDGDIRRPNVVLIEIQGVEETKDKSTHEMGFPQGIQPPDWMGMLNSIPQFNAQYQVNSSSFR